MTRVAHTIAAACTCVVLLAGGASGQTGTSDGTRCATEPTGLILERWKQLDGQFGPLGCPTGPEDPVPGRNGTRMPFEHGEVATSPDQGERMVVATYQQQDDLIVNWGDTNPFSYDKFQIRWDRDGKNVGQAEVDRYVGSTRGFYAIESPLPGRYTVILEGCTKRSLGRTRCRQKWTVPVSAQYDLPPVPAYENCGDVQRPTGFIGDRWARTGGGAGPMGCPTGPEQPRAGGTVVPFQNGEIVHSPGQGEGMTVAVYQSGERKVVTEWGPTTPYDYGLFQVRFSGGGYQDSQADRDGGIDGRLESSVGAGSYSVIVEGCNRRFPRRTRCPQKWTVPARVTVGFPPPAPLPPPGNLDFDAFPTPLTGDDALARKSDRAAKAARVVACGHRLGRVRDDEDRFMYTAIAKLFVARDDPRGDGWFRRCPASRFDLAAEVSDAIRHQEVESNAGTETGFPCKREGEYDTALKGYVTLIYRYPQLLAPDVRYRILHLLNKRGPHDPSDDRICGVLRIPETENHRMLIESSRYLTNQLLHRSTGLRKFDNGRNRESTTTGPTMDQYVLRMLQSFLKNDFVEYNSRPYQRYTFAGIQNLYDYAENPYVREAARMVLDYVSAKVAVSTLDGRRNPPYRRKAEHRQNDTLGQHADPIAGRFQLYTAPTALGVLPDGTAQEMVMAAATGYEPPKPLLDLMVHGSQRTFFQRFSHYAEEVYASEPDFLITASGTPSGYAYPKAGFGSSDDLGITPPTFLMPAGRFRDVRRMIRFDNPRPSNGSKGRPGLCVAPGFACGMKPIVPADYTPADRQGCWFRSGDATFVDFMTEQCRGVENRGFYAAVFGAGGKFGFVEAVPMRKLAGVSLAEFADRVGQQNGGRTFGPRRVNRYRAWDGNEIVFDVREDNPIRSTGLPEVDGLPKDPLSWPLADGTIVNSVGHTGLVTIGNPATGSGVTLDFRSVTSPQRTAWP